MEIKDQNSKKTTVLKYVRVGGTLGLIAASSALLIGLTNAITAPRIEENKKNEVLKKLKVCFGEDVEIDTANQKDWTAEKPAPVYVKTSYPASKDGASVGTLYQMRGTNSYGVIEMMIGVYEDDTLTRMTFVENGQSYKTTLETNYIEPFNNAADKNAALENVKCGATFGATLIRDMVNEAKQLSSGGINYTEDLEEDGLAAFGDKANMYQTYPLSSYILSYVTKGYDAYKDEFSDAGKVGQLFYAPIGSADGLYIALNSDATFSGVSASKDTADEEVLDFVEAFNAASDKDAYLDGLKGEGGSADIPTGPSEVPDDSIPTGPSDVTDGDTSGEEGGNLTETLAEVKNACLEAKTIVNGTAKQDPKLACFDAGEADDFKKIADKTGESILEIYEATLGGTKIGYVYDLKTQISVPGSTPTIEIMFSIYNDGKLGKIAVVEDGSTAGRGPMIEEGFIKVFNAASSAERAELLDIEVSGATISSNAISKMLKEAIADQKGR